MNRFFFKAALPAVALALALGAKALAVPISGNIAFSGTATLDSGLATATQATAFHNFAVQGGTGDFGAIAYGTPAGTAVSAGTPWVFDPSTPFTNLWNVAGYQFDLTGSVIDMPRSATSLVINGTGWVTKTGFDPSLGTWHFTANAPSVGGYTFSFSAGTSVPDGGTTAMLLGLGLTGLALLARWRKIA